MISNVGIARMHRLSRKLVGSVLAIANVVAFILSGLVVTAGILTYGIWRFPLMLGYWVIAYWVLFLVVGLLLAALVETLTLGQCARLRHVLEERQEIRRGYARIDNPTDTVLSRRDAELQTTRFSMISSGLLIGVGVTISTIAGTLFWHTVMSLLPDWQAWVFSTLFSGIVSFTLVSSELGKHLNNKVIGESVNADTFMQEAAREDAREQVIEKLHTQHKVEINDAVSTETFSDAIQANAETIIDEVLTGGNGTIPVRIERERELKRLELERERTLTTRQLSIVKGTFSATDTPSNVLPDSSNGRRDGERNYEAIRSLYAQMGEAYIKDHIGELASQYKITPRTIYRHLEKAKEDSGQQKTVNG